MLIDNYKSQHNKLLKLLREKFEGTEEEFIKYINSIGISNYTDENGMLQGYWEFWGGVEEDGEIVQEENAYDTKYFKCWYRDGVLHGVCRVYHNYYDDETPEQNERYLENILCFINGVVSGYNIEAKYNNKTGYTSIVELYFL